MMREETFCDIFLLVSIIKSTILHALFPTMISKRHACQRRVKYSYLNMVDCFKQLVQFFFFPNIVPYLSSVGYYYFKAKHYFDSPATFAVMCTQNEEVKACMRSFTMK